MKALAILAVAAAAVVGAAPLPAKAAAASCDRQCLYGFLDKYLVALKAKNPKGLPLAANVFNSENNVALKVGDGMWGTLSSLSNYDLRLADPTTGGVGFYGAVDEAGTLSPFGVRLKVAGGKITEIETVVARPQDAGVPFVNGKLTVKPEFAEIIPPGQRDSRAKLIAVADGYFNTLQRNDGTLHTEFADTCNRSENGMQTTNNPGAKAKYPNMALGCAQQFKLGIYRYDDELRARRYPLVDEERGMVMATGFIDHSGRIGEYKLTDGTKAVSSYRRPHTLYLLEAFKIKAGKIARIEAVFTTVPYKMPYPSK
ncbi:MAG: hypothetical protein ABIO39_07805 [Caulobacteraceae bacterium]